MKIKIRQFYEHPNGKIDFFLNMLLDVANMLFLFLYLHVGFISRISVGRIFTWPRGWFRYTESRIPWSVVVNCGI